MKAKPIPGGRWPLPLAAGSLLLALGAPAPSPAQTQPPPASGDLYDAAKQLFDQYAPPEIKAQYDFPSRQDFEEFAARLQAALDGGSLSVLADYEPQARAALTVLRSSPQYSDYADWLSARLEEIDAARTAVAEEAARAAGPLRAAPPPAGTALPYYDLWLRRLRGRPPPPNAGALMPTLRRAFAAEGVPPGLAWMAEVESSLSPTASNPSGARGLFQLKAATARDLGLSTFMPDQRTDPEKSARATARYLRGLKERFGTWPLALAAYNAGEGRVGRLLKSRRADDFAGIAPELPAGTRMYVPEVCALVAVRTGSPLGR